MKKRNKFFAFTIIELIVVITILSILGTIGFISLQGYSKYTRDSVRISDLNNIKKSLELNIATDGKLPIPDNKVDITFSGAIAWYQGTFGDNNLTNVNKLNKKPVDPLVGNEYAYSTTTQLNEYELGTILENGLSENIILKSVGAEGQEIATAYTVGNYNQKYLRVKVLSLDYLLSVPSILASDITDVSLESILNQGNLVYKGFSNLPAIYSNSIYKTNPVPGFDYTNNSPVIFTGSLNLLKETENQLSFISNLKYAYLGTILSENKNYSEIINVNENNLDQVNQLMANLSRNHVGIFPKISYNSNPVAEVNLDLPDNLVEIFSNGTSWTDSWASNSCNTENINIVEISPGTDTIPNTLLDNTIYKLQDGNYITSSTIYMGICSGLIGTKNSNLFSSSSISNIIYSGFKANNIIYGINLDGESDGLGGTHTKISTLINVSSSPSNTYRNIGLDNYNSYGLALINNSSNNYLKDITSSGGGGYGILLNSSDSNLLSDLHLNGGSIGLGVINSRYNTVDKIQGYNNSGITLSNSDYNSFSNMKMGKSSLSLINSNYNDYNNGIIYGNGGYGLLVNLNSENNSFSNLNTFGNLIGLGIFSNSISLNNISTYSNYTGIHVQDSSGVLANNLKSYNNNTGINFVGLSSGLSYYGNLETFYNTLDVNLSLLSGGSDGYLGFTNGVHDTSGVFDTVNPVDVAVPSIDGWDFVNRWSSTHTHNGDETIEFGANMPNQSQPITYNSSSSQFEISGVDGTDYDSSKKIGEW